MDEKTLISSEITIPVPWGQISGKQVGNSNNHPVLCIHGWLDNCNTFKPLIPLLPKENFYVSIDLPGHGFSSKFPEGMYYCMYSYIDVVERARNYFKWQNFSLIGHSLGGNVACFYSSTFPEYVEKLIILDSFGLYPYKITSSRDLLRKSIRQHHSITSDVKEYTYEAALTRLLAGNKNLTRTSAEILLERGLRKCENGKFIFSRDIRHNFRNPVYISKVEAKHYLQEITAEVLHVVADDGLMSKIPDGENLKEETPVFFSSCQFREWKDVSGNHHVHLNNPHKVCDHVTSFLRRPNRNKTVDQSAGPVPSSNI